jgi:molybdopterin-biosynthesis enzyme MoeA-like protein
VARYVSLVNDCGRRNQANMFIKTVDTNSAYFAKYCFALGISLKRVEVISDDEDEIAEAARRMSANYDFVVTSGGIGPT